MFNKLLLFSLAVHEIVFVKFCGRVFSYVTCLNFFHVSHFVHLWKVMNMGILCEKAVAWSKGGGWFKFDMILAQRCMLFL